MAKLAMTCPHCNVEHVQFLSCGHVQNQELVLRWTTFFRCNACYGGLVMEIIRPKDSAPGPHDYGGDPRTFPGYVVDKIYPQAATLGAPESAPPNVATYYVQGMDNLRRKHFDAAGAMCRKALDVATKAMNKELKGDLKTRIDKLASANLITPAMKEWAHAIRLDGNDAVHEEEPYSEDDAKQLASFTELFLMYAFTLPGMLDARKKKDDPPGLGAVLHKKQ